MKKYETMIYPLMVNCSEVQNEQLKSKLQIAPSFLLSISSYST